MKQCTDCMEEVIKLLAAGDYVMAGANHNSHGAKLSFPDEPKFPNMPKNGGDRRFMAMPAYLGGEFDMAGCKWYGSNIENKQKGQPRSILMLMLNDKDTGAPIALMSANLLSAYRTAGVPGAGARHLARKGSETLAIIGPGAIGRTNLEGMCEAVPTLKHLKVKGRGKKSLDSFMEYAKEKCPQLTTIEAVDTIEEAVRDSDVIDVCVSSAPKAADYPYIKTEWIKPGALFCLPASVNFDDELLTDKAKLVVDNSKLYEAWVEEFPYPTYGTVTIVGTKFYDLIHEGKLTRDKIIDLGDILTGKVPGRESDDQIIVYSVGGMPVEDVAWGKKLYENALKKGIGTKLPLWDVPQSI